MTCNVPTLKTAKRDEVLLMTTAWYRSVEVFKSPCQTTKAYSSDNGKFVIGFCPCHFVIGSGTTIVAMAFLFNLECAIVVNVLG